MISPDANDPAAIVVTRDSVRLALIASLQHLPSRQRAVLILRDVLAWPAAEVAELLGFRWPPSRARCSGPGPAWARWRLAADQVPELTEPEHRELLSRYIAAFQNADAAALERLLRQDATLEAPPLRNWYARHQVLHAVHGDACAGLAGPLADAGDQRQRPAGGRRLVSRQRRRLPALRHRGAHRDRRRHLAALPVSASPSWSPRSGSRPSRRRTTPDSRPPAPPAPPTP